MFDTITISIIVGYIFFTFLSKDLFVYFDRINTIFTIQSKNLFNLSFKILKENNENIDYIRNEDIKSSSARRDFFTFMLISLLLFSANVFVLSQFFNTVEGLNDPIFGAFSDFAFLQYSHLVAAVIILFEVGLGLLYFYFENGQKLDPDEAKYAGRLYAISFIVGICIFVEAYIWYNLSAVMGENLFFPQGINSLTEEILKGFLGFFGAAFTLGEYYYGYSISKSQSEINEKLSTKVISIFFFTFVSIWTFIGSGILYLFYVLIWGLRLLIEFIILPSKFIFKKLRLISE